MTRKNILCISFMAALAVRLSFAMFFVSSPFRFFHQVPGLDMGSLLKFSEWGAPGNFFFFTNHRFLAFSIWKLNGGNHIPELLISLQALLGCFAAVLTADSVLKISGQRKSALLAGILIAASPILLMYEFTTLQDSLVCYLALWSFHTLLVARKKHFSFSSTLIAGAVAGLASTGRPVAIGMTLLFVPAVFVWLFHHKLPLRKGLNYAAGILLIWTLYSGVNYLNGNPFNCFFNPVNYTISVNTAQTAGTAPAPAVPQVTENRLMTISKVVICNMVPRLPRLLDPVEIPENLNIYFLRSKLPFLAALPFEFLIIIGGCGILAVICSGRWKRKEGILLLPIMALALFLCVREPIGRYRMMLLPYLAMSTAWLIFYLKNKKTPRWTTVIFFLLIISGVTACSFRPRPLRSGDFTAWGWALEAEAGQTTPESFAHFEQAWIIQRNEATCVNLITRALQLNMASRAYHVSSLWAQEFPDSSLANYYAGLCAMPDWEKASHFLQKAIPEKLPLKLQFRLHFLRGEICRMQNDRSNALIHFNRALSLPEYDAKPREMMLRFINTSKENIK